MIQGYTAGGSRILVWYSIRNQMVEAVRNDGIWKEYMSQFSCCTFLPYQEVGLCDVRRPDICLEVYMAKFHKDRPINLPVLPDWILPIQVGKALTDVRVARLTDDTGDNISAKKCRLFRGDSALLDVEEHRRTGLYRAVPLPQADGNGKRYAGTLTAV